MIFTDIAYKRFLKHSEQSSLFVFKLESIIAVLRTKQ